MTMDIDFMVTLLGRLLGNKGTGPCRSWRARLVPGARWPLPTWPPGEAGSCLETPVVTAGWGRGVGRQLASGVCGPGMLLTPTGAQARHTQLRVPGGRQEGRGGQSWLKGLVYGTHGLAESFSFPVHRSTINAFHTNTLTQLNFCK